MNASYACGFHAVTKLLQHSPGACQALICTEGRNQRLLSVIALARKNKLPVRFDSRDQLARLVGTEKHQGCVLQIADAEASVQSFEQCLAGIHQRSLFLVLDGIQDPHNLGACLRTADAAGVDAVIIPKDRAVGLNATVRKVAAGGAESVPLLPVTNIARSLKQLKQAGVWIYGTGGEADAELYDFDYCLPLALVMGAEGEGLRRLTREQCDYLIKLPMLGRVESLNVSVATGVCLYEVMRSRMACSQA
ncbi:MAG: 23S rRNA (guanosine(2251)-2'-O)-methyltransferase RlmB [Gammaproteobacteria bacterium]